MLLLISERMSLAPKLNFLESSTSYFKLKKCLNTLSSLFLCVCASLPLFFFIRFPVLEFSKHSCVLSALNRRGDYLDLG